MTTVMTRRPGDRPDHPAYKPRGRKPVAVPRFYQYDILCKLFGMSPVEIKPRVTRPIINPGTVLPSATLAERQRRRGPRMDLTVDRLHALNRFAVKQAAERREFERAIHREARERRKYLASRPSLAA